MRTINQTPSTSNILIVLTICKLLLLPSTAHSNEIAVEEWTAVYNYGHGSTDEVFDMEVDTSGNVYVTGYSRSAEGERHTTIKYAPDGTELWKSHYSDGQRNAYFNNNIFLGNTGNVYVTGSYWWSDSHESAIIKYDHDGNQLWATLYSPSDSFPALLTVDSESNVYAANDSGLEKFDPNGISQWQVSLGSYNYLTGLAIDSQENICITGRYGTAKYDSDGNEIWTVPQIGNSMEIDSLDNIHVTGDTATTMYSTDGNNLWTSTENGNSLAIDHLGNTFISRYTLENEIYTLYETIKFDIDGNILWQRNHTTHGMPLVDRFGDNLAVDNFGNVYVNCPARSDFNIRHDKAVVKYDPDGNMIYEFRAGPLKSDYIDFYTNIEVDSSGNIYLAGFLWDAAQSENHLDFCTKKYSQRPPNTYTITVSSGPNGYLDMGAATEYVFEQQTIQITARPAPPMHPDYYQYDIDKWYLDGEVSDTTGPIFTLENIDSDHTLYATFKPYSSDAILEALLEPSGPFLNPWIYGSFYMETFGKNMRLNAAENLKAPLDGKNYAIDKWYLNGQQVQTGGLWYYLCNTKPPIDVIATVKEVPLEYSFTVSAGPNGTVAENLLGLGYRSLPDPNYVVDKWYVDGEVVQDGWQVFVLDDKQDRSIQVTFEKPILNMEDFASLMTHWGRQDCWEAYQCQCDCYDADLNLDRSIDLDDLMILLEYWLQPATPHGIQTLIEYNRRLELVREAIVLYKVQHLNQYPLNLATAMTTITDIGGYPWVTNEVSGPPHGPYFAHIPANPFTGGNTVDCTGDWCYDNTTGEFNGDYDIDENTTIVESPDLRPEMFLKPMQDAMKSYRYDHFGQTPDQGPMDFESSITTITDVNGEPWTGLADGLMCGPYLKEIPVNPFSDQWGIVDADGTASDILHSWFTWYGFWFGYDDDGYTPNGTPHTDLGF